MALAAAHSWKKPLDDSGEDWPAAKVLLSRVDSLCLLPRSDLARMRVRGEGEGRRGLVGGRNDRVMPLGSSVKGPLSLPLLSLSLLGGLSGSVDLGFHLLELCSCLKVFISGPGGLDGG